MDAKDCLQCDDKRMKKGNKSQLCDETAESVICVYEKKLGGSFPWENIIGGHPRCKPPPSFHATAAGCSWNSYSCARIKLICKRLFAK